MSFYVYPLRHCTIILSIAYAGQICSRLATDLFRISIWASRMRVIEQN